MTLTLTWIDYLVICLPLAAVIGVTFYMIRFMRSVADYLAASRAAGRYVICTAGAELGATVVILAATLEAFSRTGWSLSLWNSFQWPIIFFMTLLGLVYVRFRETRALTFHQFFEMRYGKGIRVFASFANIFSGLFNFGIGPAVGARFFIYFCGFPPTVAVMGHGVPTYIPVMIALMLVSLYFALSGGQVSVMVTDCIAGLISGIFYLVVALFILSVVSKGQIREAMLSGPPGQSYVDPFDIGGRPDFNLSLVVMSILFNIYIFRGGAWNAGFVAAAKSAHESQMAAILGSWRAFGANIMNTLVAVGGFTLLHHQDFAALNRHAQEVIGSIAPPQLATQMTVPIALGLLLAPGIKGAFCAIGLLGLIAAQGAAVHGYGAILLQDVVLPYKKRHLGPEEHIFWLRACAIFVGVFACGFSIWYKPMDFLQFLGPLIGSIYLGGIGAVVWGGLYWRRGTNAGAWAAMLVGTGFALVFNLAQQFWPAVNHLLIWLLGPGAAANYLAAHPDRVPLNGMQLTMVSIVGAFAAYAVVSLFTCREPFDMDRMLHRGRYRVAGEEGPVAPLRKGFAWGKVLGINEYFTRGDKIIATTTFGWTMFWAAVALAILLWNVLVKHFTSDQWFEYYYFTAIVIPLALSLVTTVWFTIGGSVDLIKLVRSLRTAKQDDSDDGTVPPSERPR